MFDSLGAYGRSSRSIGNSLVAKIAEDLIEETPAMAEELARMIHTGDAAYADIDTDELRTSMRRNLEIVLGSLAERRQLNTDYPQEIARRWTEQNVPLDAMLRALLQGFRVLWDKMAGLTLRSYPERLQDLAREGSRLWELLEEFSKLVTTAYWDTIAEAARHDERQRTIMLDALFEGRLGEWKRLGGDLRVLGLPERGPYLAVSAETLGTGAECLPGVEEVLRRRGISSVWRLRADEQVGLIALGYVGMKGTVTKILASLARGRVGLSSLHTNATETASALGTAALARRCLPQGKTGTITIDENPLASLVASSPDISLTVARLSFGKVMDLAPDERQTLLTTLRIWFQTHGKTAEAARLLYCHRNTVRNRLHRLEKLTGRSLDDPRGIAELLIAAETIRLLQSPRQTKRQLPQVAQV